MRDGRTCFNVILSGTIYGPPIVAERTRTLPDDLHCYYCDQIHSADSRYVPRNAEFDTGSEAPRCALHWRFICDHCGEPGHFMARFHCPASGQLLCGKSGEMRIEEGEFWAWQYFSALSCPVCGEEHPSLDYAEYTGTHPWQLTPALEAERKWLSAEKELRRYPVFRFPRVDLNSLQDDDSDANWSANADIWNSYYDERGDSNRRYQSDAVLLDFLGDVSGQYVLDAGSGAGYLSRILAKRGACMVGVENARRFYEIALGYQAQEPLAIEYHHASISHMPFLEDSSFDAAVANYVLMDVRDYRSAIGEIARVIKPGGRFVCAISPTPPDARPYTPAADSPRREDREGWLEDDYFIERAAYTWWADLKPLLSFHRPLRDYVKACKEHGLTLVDLDEPEVTEEGVRELPAYRVRELRRRPFSWMLKFEKKPETSN